MWSEDGVETIWQYLKKLGVAEGRADNRQLAGRLSKLAEERAWHSIIDS